MYAANSIGRYPFPPSQFQPRFFLIYSVRSSFLDRLSNAKEEEFAFSYGGKGGEYEGRTRRATKSDPPLLVSPT